MQLDRQTGLIQILDIQMDRNYREIDENRQIDENREIDENGEIDEDRVIDIIDRCEGLRVTVNNLHTRSFTCLIFGNGFLSEEYY